MIDTKELRRLAQAATPGPWKLLTVGDRAKRFAVADINFLSVLTVVDECGTSFGAVYLDGDAKFIAAANPAVISELLDRLEAAEKERDDLLAKIEETEQREPAGWIGLGPRDGRIEFSTHRPAPSVMRDFNVKPLYLATGAQGEEK